MMRYLYRCRLCGEVYEAERRVAERDAPFVCVCGSACERLFAPTVNIFVPCYSFHNASRGETGHLPVTEAERRVWEERG